MRRILKLICDPDVSRLATLLARLRRAHEIDSSVPKQLRKMIKEFVTPKASNNLAQGNTLGKHVPQTISYPERV
jgi:hypothetical protein